MKTRFPSLFASLALLSLTAAPLLVSSPARADMTETERKAAARAAFQEGVKLQDDGKAAEALTRFDSAEKLFDAPTHLLHIAECQALTGRLVEASETYETLARKKLGPNAPEAFTAAQEQGAAELGAVRARIPTLRVSIVTRPPNEKVQNLSINVNGVSMPTELVNIARPLNPGVYRFSAQATGLATERSIDVPLAEKEQKSIELVLVRSAAGAVVVVAPPPPVIVGPVGSSAPPPPAPYAAETPKPKTKPGPTSFGFLLGVRAGLSVPGGSVTQQADMDAAASTGGAFGIDVYARLARAMLLGITFEHDFLGGAKALPQLPSGTTVNTSANANYFGVNLGIIPNVDKVSFIGDIGIGQRWLNYDIGQSSGQAKGLEFHVGVGISIPVGPIRLAPLASLGIGSFSSGSVNGNSADVASGNSEAHVFAFLGLGGYYSADIGKKPE
ncbi:MAG: hypothetical protein JWP97_5211 [Labilithrix sp.]|nr:hypothetical protein [Labilithrix sp.]